MCGCVTLCQKRDTLPASLASRHNACCLANCLLNDNSERVGSKLLVQIRLYVHVILRFMDVWYDVRDIQPRCVDPETANMQDAVSLGRSLLPPHTHWARLLVMVVAHLELVSAGHHRYPLAHLGIRPRDRAYLDPHWHWAWALSPLEPIVG